MVVLRIVGQVLIAVSLILLGADAMASLKADDVVVNLSAFETFFPEKRLFFLEGREIFQETPRAGTGSGFRGNHVEVAVPAGSLTTTHR